MSEQFNSRTALRMLCWDDESAEMIADSIEQLQRANAALRSLAAAMADEMEQHGGEQAFDSLTRYRAEVEQEGQP